MPFRFVAVLLLLLLLLLGLFACTCLTHHPSPPLLLIRLTHSTPSSAPPLLPLQAFARHYSQLRHTNKLSASRFPADGFYITHTAHAHTHTRKNLFSVKPGILRGGEEREVHTICGVYTRVN